MRSVWWLSQQHSTLNPSLSFSLNRQHLTMHNEKIVSRLSHKRRIVFVSTPGTRTSYQSSLTTYLASSTHFIGTNSFHHYLSKSCSTFMAIIPGCGSS